jgi:hypothetical protein
MKKLMGTGWFAAPDAVFGDNGLTALEKLCFLYFCRRAGSDGSSFPSYKTIARDIAVGRSTAIKLVQSLEAKKLIRKIPRRRVDGSFTSNTYTLTLNRQGVVHAADQGGLLNTPGVVHHRDLKEGQYNLEGVHNEGGREGAASLAPPPLSLAIHSLAKAASNGFPSKWYDQVQETVERIRGGAKMSGRQIAIFRKHLKTIFEAGHTPEQVIAFYEWCDTLPPRGILSPASDTDTGTHQIAGVSHWRFAASCGGGGHAQGAAYFCTEADVGRVRSGETHGDHREVWLTMPYNNKLGDAAPIQNKLSELSNDLWAVRSLIELRFAELERVFKIDVAMRAGVLRPEEAARLLARPDARVVIEAIQDVLRNRISTKG